MANFLLQSLKRLNRRTKRETDSGNYYGQHAIPSLSEASTHSEKNQRENSCLGQKLRVEIPIQVKFMIEIRVQGKMQDANSLFRSEKNRFRYRQYLSGKNPDLRAKMRKNLDQWSTGHLVLKIFPFQAFKDNARKKRNEQHKIDRASQKQKECRLNLWKISKVHYEQQEWKSAYGTP